jgi:hypothetical protein
MPDQGQEPEQLGALRDSLRKLEAVLNFAHRLLRDQGGIPQGLVDDFIDARRELEKQFVLVYQHLEEQTQSGLRNMLQATRTIDADKLEENLPRLSRRVRSVLNRIVIAESENLSLTTEVGKVKLDDIEDEAEVNDPPRPAGTSPATASAPPKTEAPPSPRPALRRALVALVLIAVLGVVGLVAAFAAGAFKSTPMRPPVTVADADTRDEDSPAEDRRPQPQDHSTPFDAPAAGYTSEPRVSPPGALNPLTVDPDVIVADQFTALMLGVEDLVAIAEPTRLRRSPSGTRAGLLRYAEGAVEEVPNWMDEHKPLLDGFAEHMRSRMQLARYPQQGNEHVVLISDVLYASGGPQLPLVVTLYALAQYSGLPLSPMAPHGPEMPVIGYELQDGLHTYNGESHGLRSGTPVILTAGVALLHLARLLHPTMESPEGRLLTTALVYRYGGGTFTPAQAREALADIDAGWLQEPEVEEGADNAEFLRLRHHLARKLAGPICRAMIVETVNATADETLRLYRLAQGLEEHDLARYALELLGNRSSPGTMLDGVPLSLAVGEMLLDQDRADEAEPWFRRAMQEHTSDPRPVMRLIAMLEGDEVYELIREAYVRGERSLGLMRSYARLAAENGQMLLALALYDDLCSGSAFDSDDLRNAVLACIELGKPDWGLQRLAEHEDLVRGEVELLRLNLLLELSENGYSARAQRLMVAWRTSGHSDPLLEDLLRRYGG